MADRRQHLVSKPPAFSRCGRCNALTLTGIDQGIAFRIDPLPVTIQSELAARRSGRGSWTVADNRNVYYRDVHRIKVDAGKPVCLSHECEAEAGELDTDTAAAFAEIIKRTVKRDTSNDETLVLLRRELGATVYSEEPPY